MSNEIYTLTINSSRVTNIENSGNRLSGKYRVNWSQILPSKYRRFKVSAYFRSGQSSTPAVLASLATVCIQTNLSASSSYQVLNQGRSNLLCVSEKVIVFSGLTYFSYNICRDLDSHLLIIDYPIESYINVNLVNIDGISALTANDIDTDFVLVLSFEPVEEGKI